MAKIRFDDSGFRELKRRLKELESTKKVKVGELFDRRFMTKYTPYDDIGEMIKAAGISISSIDNDKALANNPSWNQFIAEKTRFANWDDMVKAAGIEYARRKLGMC